MTSGRFLTTLLLAGLAMAGPARAFAQSGDQATPSHPGDALRVFLMTIGQGDIVWEKFSHNAILIQNEEEGWAKGYNWGVFDFDQADFWPRLLRGAMLYKMDPFDPGLALRVNELRDRAVWVQELDLSPEQKVELNDFVEWNALPENADYRYDYYRDNCSTRVRDVLDSVLDGQLRATAEADTTTGTYRWHTRRLLRTRPAEYFGIQLVLNADADRPLTGWEELFLPIKLMERVREIQVPDGAGGMKPLVAMERQLLDTSRPPIPTDIPFAAPFFLLVGVFWGGGILLLARKGGPGSRVGRFGLSTLAGFWCLLSAVCGTVLLMAWAFTEHVFWHGNLNLLQMNPLFLLVLSAYLLFLFRGTFPGWGGQVALGLAFLSMAGLVVWIIPGLGQMNGEILALTVPVNLSLTLGSHWLQVRPGVGESGEGKEKS